MLKKRFNYTALFLLLLCLLGIQVLVASKCIFSDHLVVKDLSKNFFDFNKANTNLVEEKTDNENSENDYEDIKIANAESSFDNFLKIIVRKSAISDHKLKKSYLNIPSSPPNNC